MDKQDKEWQHEQEDIERELRGMEQELKNAARDFGSAVGDLGTAVGGAARAAVNAANDGINRAARSAGFGSFFGGGKPTPADDIRQSAQKRRGAGLALMIVGGTLALSFLIGGIAVLASMPYVAADAANTAAFTADIVDGVVIEMGDAVATGGEFAADFGSAAYTAMGVTGGLLEVAAAGFGYMMWAGWQRIKASRWLRHCADTVEGMDEAEGVSLGLLEDGSTNNKPNKLLKKTRKYIQKGWLTAWLDERAGKIYLTAESYRAAQQAKRTPKPEPQKPKEQADEQTPVNLETARRFVSVLKAERAVMRDEQAAEELEHMQKTAAAICDWLETHPESLPKTRRFAEYYIPTTLKLLRTYNDVQGKTGENAEAIQRDIAGILHTLNQAFDNLYNTLLSDMALDVSSEIAALEGMLANDGLAGEGML